MKAKQFLDDINNTIELNQDRSKRHYLGGSAVGDECLRKLQYSFRHCAESNFTASTLKKFDDGHRSEAIYIDRIKAAGYQLQHEENGVQYGFEDIGGWFRGHRDGKLFKLAVLNNQDAIWEHKSSVGWKKLDNLVSKDESTALENWNYTYFVQGQLYMGYDGTKYHFTTCSSEGSRDETACVTEFNPALFNQIKEKAYKIITSDNLLPKVSNNPTNFRCKMCDSSDVCHKGKIPKPNCRNCASLDFLTDGNCKAKCNKYGHTFENDVKSLASYYGCHTFLPELIDSNAIIDGLVSFHDTGLRYQIGDDVFINGNGDGAISSWDLYQGGLPFVKNPVVQSLLNVMGGTLTKTVNKEIDFEKPFDINDI